jgi:hypothetical protein
MPELIGHHQKIGKIEPMNYIYGAIYRFGADKPAVFVAASRRI